MSTPIDIPALEGYLSVPDVAKEIGVSRQRAHQIIKAGAFEGVRSIGEQSVLVVPVESVQAYKRLNPKKSADQA